MSDFFTSMNSTAESPLSKIYRPQFKPELRENLTGSGPLRVEGNLTNVADKLVNFEDSFDARLAEYRLKHPTPATLIAERNEAAQRLDDAARYQAALNFGPDFVTHITSKIDRDYNAEVPVEDESSKPRSQGETFTHVTAQGTVVGIDRVRSIDNLMSVNNTIQITRKDGLQLNFELTEDMRITDLEDGSLSIYYASTGISRIFDAEGKESTVQGEMNALGTSGDDLIINVSGKRVDAGNGDDTLFNFADGAEILGGAGNDKIYLASREATGVTIDGGAGDDAIVGENINGATITMEEGTDSLTAFSLNGSNITSSGDNRLNIRLFSNNRLTSRNGLLDMKIENILESSLSIDRAKAMSVDSIQGSNLSFGASDVTLNACLVSGSRILTGGGNDVITVYGLTNSFINTNGGDDTIEVGRSAIDSTVFSGDGNDTINVYKNFDSRFY